MFPVLTEKMSFLDIAKFWSREIKPFASLQELLALLEAAWWRGEIIGDSDRFELLKAMFSKQRDHLHSIVFVTPDDKGPPTSRPLATGEVLVDMRARIIVPGKTDSWTKDCCADAFETLAGSPSHEYFPEFSIAIHFIELTWEEFFSWVVTRGFDSPKFWQSRRTIANERGLSANPTTEQRSLIPIKVENREKVRSESAKKPLGKKKGDGSYEALDAPFLQRMSEILGQNRAASVEEAARLVAEQAHGGGTIKSKAERLARRYRAQRGER